MTKYIYSDAAKHIKHLYGEVHHNFISEEKSSIYYQILPIQIRTLDYSSSRFYYWIPSKVLLLVFAKSSVTGSRQEFWFWISTKVLLLDLANLYDKLLLAATVQPIGPFIFIWEARSST